MDRARNDDDSPRPGLTIRIRRVNERGVETESYPTVALPAGAPLTTSVWPPCRCGLCGHGGTLRRQAGRTAP